ncbi:MAG: hydrogenase subunit MbhD domain-containing protein [Alsobacter sp.]
MSLVIDTLLGAMLVALALRCALARDAISAVMAFISLGLLLAIAWVRLGSVDVALTEAAIGSGATGFLLIGAHAHLRRSGRGEAGEGAPLGREARAVVAVAAAIVGVAVAWALLTLPDPAPSLAPAAVANMPATGLGNAVTAVLIAYRSLDTLLETIVLVLAVVGLWALAPQGSWGGPGRLRLASAPAPLVFLARALPPVGVLAGIYLFWEGANAPGGAFQGGTVLAAMAVLAMLAGLAAVPRMDAGWLRWSLVFGAGLFTLVGFLGVLTGGSFLAFPDVATKPVILAVEAGLTFSIAAGLAMLVAGQTQGPGR